MKLKIANGDIGEALRDPCYLTHFVGPREGFFMADNTNVGQT
jgi:hypothetical protein